MNYKITHNCLLDYINDNKLNYRQKYEYKNMQNQELFNEYFAKLIKEKSTRTVLIYTDYDSDGIHGGLILSEAFKNLEIKFDWYINSRQNGYGINEDVICELFKNHEYTDFISIDLGITNGEVVEFMKDNWNPFVIITDHHTIQQEKYPKYADIVVNPKLNLESPENFLCGAGVIYKLVEEFYCNQAMKIWSGIATIGDMVPLNPYSENKNIVTECLRIINNEEIENERIRFLFQNMYGFGNKIITEMDIAFNIVPMINSLSRYYLEDIAAEYYHNSDKYNEIYFKMKETNDIRKKEQKELEQQALLKITKNDIETILLETDKKSLLGIVSSFIVNSHNKPNYVMIKTEKGYYGSCRSTDDLDIYEYTTKMPSEWFINFGGHPKAAGFCIKLEYYNDFCDYVSKTKLEKKSIENVIEMSNSDFDELLIPMLKKFSPFGEGNKSPIFILKEIQIEKSRTLKEHLFLTGSFESNNDFNKNEFEILYFFFDLKLKKGDKINAIGTFDINRNFYVQQIEKI